MLNEMPLAIYFVFFLIVDVFCFDLGNRNNNIQSHSLPPDINSRDLHITGNPTFIYGTQTNVNRDYNKSERDMSGKLVKFCVYVAY